MNNKLSGFFYRSFAIVIIFALIAGCGPTPSKPSSPVSIDIELLNTYPVDKEIHLPIRISSKIPVSNIDVYFTLSSNLSIVKNDFTNVFNLNANESQNGNIVIHIGGEGYGQLQIDAVGDQKGQAILGNQKIIYFEVRDNEVAASEVPFENSITTAQAENSTRKMDSPVYSSLGLGNHLSADQPFDLDLTVNSLTDFEDCSLTFHTPDGIELLSGKESWTGSISREQTLQFGNRFFAPSYGVYEFLTEFNCNFEGATLGGVSNLVIEVNSDGVNIQDAAATLQMVPDALSVSDIQTINGIKEYDTPATNSAEYKVLSENAPFLAPREEQNQTAAQSNGGTVTVYGYWSYTDRNNNYKALSDARVEIWDDDGDTDQLLSYTYTDENGYYSATVPNTDSLGSNGQDIYVRVYSTDDFSVKVTLLDSSTAIYSSISNTASDVPDGSYYVGNLAVTDPTRRMAFYIYDVIANNAFDFFFNLGWTNNHNLQVEWEPSNTKFGTYYTIGGSISLLGGDRWDEDVILHEYGHFVMDKIYFVFPAFLNCNPHYWGGHSSTGCAWVEGWANFIQGAIQNHQDYIDSEDTNIHIYMEPPSPYADHPEDEGAVAASLWDIFDMQSEAHDSLADGMNGIWTVFSDYFPTTVEDFWGKWVSSPNEKDCQVATILQHHLINYGTSCPPEPFSKISPTNGAAGQPNSLTLSWGASTGATSYEYCYGITTPCTNWTSNGSATSVTSSSLLPNTTYYWNVRAINGYGTTYSNESTPDWSFRTASIGIPAISSLSPVSALVGDGGFTLTVNGTGFTNFTPGNTVYWNGAARATTFFSPTQLSAFIPAADIASISLANVTVKNQNSVESNAIQFGIHTFTDALPSAWYWRWVEGFYAQGITTGCAANPAKYCPDRAVTRAEMAVFILRAKNGLDTPTPSTADMFADVPVTGKEWMKPWIEEFYNEGITTGCAVGPLQYCPERQVTRAEMAVFILRAIHGPDYVPPVATGVFSDVPVAGKAWMQPWIEQFYSEGITTGCASSPLRYCPEQSVTRAEMAVFIDRAFGYPQLPQD